jgi:NAD-dependent deacetylase
MAVASIQGWWRDPQRVLDFYNMRRRDVRNAAPNDAHFALAELERAHEVVVITQNVDNLHERAGSTRVIHLHGEVLKAREDRETALPIDWIEDLNLGDGHPVSGIQLRPHIVWFGEGLDELPGALAVALADDVDLLIVVGTTLNVFPAAMIATDTRAKRVILVDPDPPGLDVPNLTVVRDVATVGIRRVVDQLLGGR